VIRYNAIVLGATLLCLCGCSGLKIHIITALKGGKPEPLSHPVEIPFTISGSHIVTVPAQLNGRTFPVVFDTGGITMIDSSLCDSMSLPSKTFGDLTLAPIGRISLGELGVRDMKAAVIAFETDFKMQRFGLKGMIGSDFLRFYRTTIDYEKQTITFSKPVRIQNRDPNKHLMNMSLVVPCLPTVPVRINDEFNMKGLIDTGLHYAFVLRYSMLEKMLPEIRNRAVTCDGWFARWPYTRENRNAIAVVGQIRIGDIILRDQTVIFADFPEMMGENTMLVGRGFMQNYLTTLDYSHRQVCFQDLRTIREDLGYGIGLNLTRDGEGYVVKGVWKGSPGERAGIHAGDRFTAVEGRRDLPDVELYQLLVDPAVEEIELTTSSGQKLVLLKEDFVNTARVPQDH
jgi:hypothetical protein